MVTPNLIVREWVQGSPVEPELLRGSAYTEEAGAHTFRIIGKNSVRDPVPLSGTVLAKVIRADNTTVDVDGSIEDGEAVLTLVGDCYNVAGRISVVIYLSDGVNTVAIYAAILNVYRGTSGQEIDSGTTVPSLQQLEAAYQAALEAAEVANEAAEEALDAADHGVRHDIEQSLTESEKEQARENIEANMDVGLYIDSEGYICQN